MKNFKSLLPFLLMLFVWAGCDTDDLRNDVDELKNRVESLEAQVSAINDNMNVLKVLTDGKQTIQSCVYDEASNSYKLVLSDNTELTLTQGKQGTVNYPQITISQNGTWVINGEDSGKEAVGDNAPTPKFAIDANGYWTVDFGNGATQVLGADGQPVLATTSGSVTVTDEFFKDVDVANGALVVTLQNDEKYSLPIVEALVCDIQTENVNEFKNGVLTVGYGEEVSLNVKVEGDNAFVSAPAGWTAVLGEPDARTNIAVLTLKAPAESAASTTLGRAATADNTKDLTVQVNKGVVWAVDKIQVEATKVISSYKALYDAGETITIGGIEINKEKFPNVKYITEKTVMDSGDALYFVSPDAELEYIDTGTPSFNISNTLIIGDNPSEKSHFTISDGFLKLKEATEADKSLFLCHNLEINSLNNSKGYSMINYGPIKNVVFDDCYFKLAKEKPFYSNSNESDVTRDIENLVITNSILDFSDVTKSFFVADKLAYTFNVTLKNNIFYAKNDYIVRLFSFAKSTVGFTLQNNTFYKVTSGTNAYIYAEKLSTFIVDHNIFYSTTFTGNNLVAKSSVSGSKFDLTSTSCSFSNNVGVKGEYISSDETKTSIWQMFYGGVKVDGCDVIENMDVNATPFSSIDEDKMQFIPNATYAEYGAKFE